MTTQSLQLSEDFQRLYCDAAFFDSFSTFHPISFRRVLPFQEQDAVIDDQQLIFAEEAVRADNNADTRGALVDEYFRCGLLEQRDAVNLKAAIDSFDLEFFDLMGQTYANAGMFRCALRWYGELIGLLENQVPALPEDRESPYAGVGYCLYALGLFEEAIAWSKSCIGPLAMADAICQALVAYEVPPPGLIWGVERSGVRTRYTISAPVPTNVGETAERLKAAMKETVPFVDFYIDWIKPQATAPEPVPDGYPLKVVLDSGDLIRHKLTLIYATCARADALVEKGFQFEAKQLLCEVALIEPQAEIVSERLKGLM